MLPILQRSVMVGAKGCYSTNVYTTTCLCAAQGVDPCWLSIASSPFNTIIPDILIAKLVNLDLDTMCWCTPSPCGTLVAIKLKLKTASTFGLSELSMHQNTDKPAAFPFELMVTWVCVCQRGWMWVCTREQTPIQLFCAISWQMCNSPIFLW